VGIVPGDSPAGARRRVRLAIRQARDGLGLTQAQVAEQMDWSLSKMMRIESGEVTITPNDLKPLLAYLQITDAAAVERLVQDARTSRRRAMWWDDARFREHLSPPSRQLVQYEAEATEFRYYQQHIAVPGTLQIKEYAEAVVNSYGMDKAAAEAILEARERRRAALLERIDRVSVYLLLDEAALRRRMAPVPILSAQFAELLRLTERRRFHLRVLDFAADVPPPMFGPFDILNLPGKAEDSILYRESQFVDELVEDPVSVSRHREMFDELWAGAQDESRSHTTIEDAISALGGSVAGSSGTVSKPKRSTRRTSRTEPQ
jgi:transcriptional regulator with XRE-family HTH domain